MTIKQLENKITKKMKERIKQLDLIDTGALYRSISTNIKIVGDDLQIIINSEYYIVYLDDRYEVTSWVFNQVADDIVKVKTNLLFNSF